MKKVWCRHIKYTSFDGDLSWTASYAYAFTNKLPLVPIPSDWNYCPICKTPRPKQTTKRKGK